MKCAEIQNAIPEYFEDLLSEAIRLEIREHLNECAACQNHASRISSVSGDLKRLAQVSVPFDLEKAVLEKLSQGTFSEDRKSTWPALVLWAVILGGIFFGGYFMMTRSSIKSTTSSEVVEKKEPLSPKEIQDAMIMENLKSMEAKLSRTSGGKSGEKGQNRMTVTDLGPLHWHLAFPDPRERQAFFQKIKTVSGTAKLEQEYLLIFSLDQTKLESVIRIIEQSSGSILDGPKIDMDTLPRSESPLRVFIFAEARGGKVVPIWWQLEFLRRNGYSFIKQLHEAGFKFIYESSELIVLQSSPEEHRRLRSEMQKMMGLQILRGNGHDPQLEESQNQNEFPALLFLT